MAQPNISIKSYGGSEKESFREFERLLRSIIAVTAIDAAQHANFLQLSLKDAALRFFQLLPEATRNNFENSLTAQRNHFCNPQLTELRVIKLESIKFDPKTDSPENFLITLQYMALKAYPDPTPEVAPHGADVAAINAVNERNAEALRFAQQERDHQIKRFFKKCMPSWLRAKLLEQPDNATIEDLCLIARKQLTIHNLCKIDGYADAVFNEVSNSTINENLVNVLSKLTQTQEAVQNQVNELSKKFEEQRKNFQENQGRGRGRGDYNYRGNRGNFRGRNNFRGRGSYRGRENYTNHDYRFNFPATNSNNQAVSSQLPQNPPAQSSQTGNVQVHQPPDSSQDHVSVTQYAQVICYLCGYPNHLASECFLNKNRQNRRGGGNFPFNRQPKNQKSHMSLSLVILLILICR